MTKVSHPIAARPEHGAGQSDDRRAVRAERPWAGIPAGATLAGSGEVSVTTTDLWRMSATDLAAAIRSGQASRREVLEAHLRRIEAVNPSVNAVTAVLGEQALAAAKAADHAVAGGGELRPLHGVPFTVKENIDLAGTPTTQGIKAFAGAVPDRDAPHAARLRAAGAIPIGHTNCPDLGIRWHADSDLWGATINPSWDRSRTPATPAAARRRRWRPA
jgi:amidase